MSSTCLVAVASKSGIAIDLHFGHATRFHIYQLDVAEGGEILPLLIAEREVDNYCHGQTGNQSAMQKILATINDCDAVFCAKVGDGPIEKLARIGVTAVTEYAYLEITESVQAWAQDQMHAGMDEEIATC